MGRYYVCNADRFSVSIFLSDPKPGVGGQHFRPGYGIGEHRPVTDIGHYIYPERAAPYRRFPACGKRIRGKDRLYVPAFAIVFKSL